MRKYAVPGTLRGAMRRLGPVALALCLAPPPAGCGPRGRLYSALGVVEEVQPETRQVVIAHEDIPGLMPAMTMNFDVAEPALLERLEPGQRIHFVLESSGGRYRLRSARVLARAETRGGPRLAGLAATAHPAPAFELVDQEGERRSLADWRGRAVLLDFIYTHCPGPCPILTGLHVEVQKALPAALRDRVWFASISLDPERDTPERLRAYAGARGADLTGWSFLTGEKGVVEEVLRSYGVWSGPGEEGEIDHLVATFLIDGEGRIVRVYTGLDHEPAELAGDLRALAEPSG